jgi:cytochrome c biogenesis protein CcmG/thiol:disulfide interchange protein DsbE
MKRYPYLLPLAGFVLLLVVLVVALVRLPQKGLIVSPLLGKAAPEFSVPNLFVGQKPVDTAQLKGHWSVVNVWGTWCEVCREEHSTLLMIKQQGRVPIIGIDWNDTAADAVAWLGQLGNPYSQIGVDRNGRLAIDWGVYAAPESFLVNPQGVVVYKQVGAITPEVWRNEFLARIDASAPDGGG